MSDEGLYILLIYLSVGLALLWAAFNAYCVLKIKLVPISHVDSEAEYLVDTQSIDQIKMIGEKISKGAKAFLFAEYLVMLIFIVLFGIVVLVLVDIFGENEGT